MLTQTIMVNLTQSKLSAIIMRSEEKGREIQFEVIDAAGEAVDLTEYAVKFIMLKPDENIVMTDAVNGVVTQTEQMTTAKGAGYYCIRLLDDDTVVYSGQGKVLIDDHVVDDETLQSISEVDGLIFPDDFLTTDSPVAMIDDTDTSADTTWSSNKISGEISTSAAGIIDDNATDTDTTWSSDKISSELSALSAITITPVYNAVSLTNSDISISYGDYDALIIYVNDALTQSGVSYIFTKQYMDYCRANGRTLTLYPYFSAYVSYNILTDKLEHAGDNNQGFYIIRIDGINF